MVSLARKNLMYDRLRSLITVSGVAFAVTLVLVQVGLFMGLLDKATTTIEHCRADVWVTSKNTPNIDFAHGFPETVVLRVRGVPGVERADNLIVQFMDIQLPSGAQDGILVYGLEDSRYWNLPWKVTRGDVDDLRRGLNMFMDVSAERRFGPFQVGDFREITQRIRFRIIGTTEEAASFTTAPIVFMDYGNAQDTIEFLHGRTSYVMVKVAPGAEPERVAAEIRRRLPHHDVHTRAEWARRSRTYWIVSTGLGINIGVTVFLGILVGVVVVAQTMYTSALEHVREFGTVKAIGGSNWDIYKILGEQALIAAVVGFVAGAALSFAARPLLAHLAINVMLTWPLLLAALLGTLVMCLGAAMLSFHRVAKIDPALVFRG